MRIADEIHSMDVMVEDSATFFDVMKKAAWKDPLFKQVFFANF